MEEQIEQVTVKQVSIKWGLISGVISIAFFLIISMSGLTGESWTAIIGILLTVALMYMAHKEFKDQGDGYMSYGQGLGIGTLMSLLSALLSSAFTYMYIKFIDTEYFENAQAIMIEKWEEQGMSQDQIDISLDMMSKMQTPELTAGMGILGGVLIGFIIALIVSAITKNANPAEDY